MEELENLISKAQTGDTDAFDAIIRRFENMAVAMARSILRDHDLAEDAAQEAFIQVYRDLATLREGRAFPSWLRRIIAKHCDRIMRRKRIPTVPLDDAEKISNRDPDPAAVAQHLEMREKVLDAIRALPETQRHAATLFYLDGHSEKRVARLLDVPVTTVKKRLYSSRQGLRERLGPFYSIEASSRSKEIRRWLPSKFWGKGTDMTLQHEQTKRSLLRGGVEVVIRAMSREDIPALRRYNDEADALLETANTQRAPGTESSPGGPWANDAELVAHFDRYAKAGNITLLAEDPSGKIVGFADLWAAREPAPFGNSLDVECIDYFRDYYYLGLENVLLSEAEKVARATGLKALDIGSNTVSGDYPSLRRFGMKVFYEYDDVLCRSRSTKPSRRFTHRERTPKDVALSGLVRVSHWAPTDFTFRAGFLKSEDGWSANGWMTEITSGKNRAILELWRFDPETNENPPVPENVPNRSELYAEPTLLTSSADLSVLLEQCACIAAELGASEIYLPCPSELELDPNHVDVLDRKFAFSWFRKCLRANC
jgi:RNA polymerase sigma factor (sigma-70 family)